MTTSEYMWQVRAYYLMSEGPLRNVAEDIEKLLGIIMAYERELHSAHYNCSGIKEKIEASFAVAQNIANGPWTAEASE